MFLTSLWYRLLLFVCERLLLLSFWYNFRGWFHKSGILCKYFNKFEVYVIGKYFLIISKLETYFAFWVYSISIDSMVTASKAEMKNLINKEGFWN